MSEHLDLEIDLMSLLKSGAHFGHRISRWHPNMRPYIFTTRNKVHIIDLEKTQEMLLKALEEMVATIDRGEHILFVGTKRQAKIPLEKATSICREPYVVQRWLGGTLTNFKTVANRVKRMKDLEHQFETKDVEKYTKKERLLLKKELDELRKKFDGIRDLDKLPGMLFAIDMNKDEIAINEAKKLNIPVIALADTNTDPRSVDFPIPCNDDAVKVLEYMTMTIAKELAKAKDRKKAHVEETEHAGKAKEQDKQQTPTQ